jgi:hypothetical protein
MVRPKLAMRSWPVSMVISSNGLITEAQRGNWSSTISLEMDVSQDRHSVITSNPEEPYGLLEISNVLWPVF